jgi:ribosomal protein S26
MAGDTFGPESFPTYVVNPTGTSVDDDKCVVPVTKYEQSQADWAEDFSWGGRFYVNFTAQPEVHVAAIRALVATDCAVYIRIVPVSSAIGRALQERITDDAVAHVVPGVQVALVGFDPVSDRVLVGIVGPVTPQIRADFESRYPAEMIELFEKMPALPAAS